MAEKFVNRAPELNRLRQTSILLKRSTPKHLALISARRVGKTTLIREHFKRSRDPKIVFLEIDCLYLTSWARLCDQIIETMQREYTRQTGNKLRVERFVNWFTGTVKDIFNRVTEIEAELGSAAGEYLKLRISLKDLPKDEIDLVRHAFISIEEFAKKRGVYFTVFFDEFQHIQKFGAYEEAIAAIRNVAQGQTRIQYIFSGSSVTFMQKIFTVETAAFWKQVEILKLNPFDRDGVREYIEKNCPIKFDHEALVRLETRSRGIPDYIRKITDELKLLDLKVVKAFDVDRAFEQVAEKETQLFNILLDRLTPIQQTLLQAIAHGKKKYSELEEIVGEEVGAGSLLANMIESQLIVRPSKGEYAIFDPVLEYHLARRPVGIMMGELRPTTPGERALRPDEI